MEEKGLTVADALALRNGGNNNGFGDFGGSGWWVIILILFLMGGRWGNYGGNDGGTNTVVVPSNFGNGGSCCGQPVTCQALNDAFNFNSLDNGVRGVQDSIASGFYANNLATTNLGTAMQTGFGQVALQTCQGFNGVNSTINQAANSNLIAMNGGFNGVQSSLCNGFNEISRELANNNFNTTNCCCETRESIMQSNFNNQASFANVLTSLASNACDVERGQDDIKYLMAQNQSATLTAIDHVGDRLIDYMNQSKMDELRTELQNAKFQISQSAQTEMLLNSLQPVAKPSYIVSSPYQSLYNAVNGCGCGNF